MKLRLFVILFFMSISLNANAYYMSLNASYDSIKNPILSNVGASLSGIAPVVSFGFDKTKFKMPIEIFFGQGNLQGTLNHDGRDVDAGLKQTIYGIRSNLIISSRLYLLVGYTISQNEFIFKSESSLSRRGIRGTYDFKDGEASGFMYGVGLNLTKGKRPNMYLEYKLNSFSENKISSSSVNIGFRHKL